VGEGFSLGESSSPNSSLSRSRSSLRVSPQRFLRLGFLALHFVIPRGRAGGVLRILFGLFPDECLGLLVFFSLVVEFLGLSADLGVAGESTTSPSFSPSLVEGERRNSPSRPPLYSSPPYCPDEEDGCRSRFCLALLLRTNFSTIFSATLEVRLGFLFFFTRDCWRGLVLGSRVCVVLFFGVCLRTSFTFFVGGMVDGVWRVGGSVLAGYKVVAFALERVMRGIGDTGERRRFGGMFGMVSVRVDFVVFV
jgi:hypothetical protein